MPLHGVNTPERQAAFFGQVNQETGGLTSVRESMYYTTAARLHAVYPGFFPTEKSAEPYVKNPEALANVVYANRKELGNGNAASGDAMKYRGAGVLQITGKGNFKPLGDEIGVDLVKQPELLSNDVETSVRAALQYWSDRDINKYADEHSNKNLKTITELVNGHGLQGLAERSEATKSILKILSKKNGQTKQ